VSIVSQGGPSAAEPPVAKAVPHAITAGTHTRVDPYFWMRDRANPDVQAYLEAENAYTQAMTASNGELQAALYGEILGHIKQTDLSAPYPRRGFMYYVRTEEGRQYPILCRRRGSMQGDEEVLLDLNVLAEGKPFLGLGAFEISDDSGLLAYTFDETGYRRYTLAVKNLATGELLADRAERVNDVAWSSDNRTLLYVTEDEVSKRSDTLRVHPLGGEPQTVWHESDAQFDVRLRRTRDGAYVIVESVARDTAEARFLSAGSPFGEPVLFRARQEGVLYDLDHREGLFYVRTNEDAPDFRVFTAPVAEFQRREAWRELVAQRPGTTIDEIALFRDFGVILGRRHGLASLEVLDCESGQLTPLDFEEPDYVVELGRNEEYATPAVRITYQSLVTPAAVYDVNAATRERVLVKRTEVPGYDPSLYRAERVFADAPDGTRIPVSLVSRRDREQGPGPLLLYGYGSYGISIDPAFSAARLPLLDRGVTYAIAHIRGGGEYGEAWRLAGNLRNKRTSFSDFIACAEHLIARAYTSPAQLAIMGGSAGGLLMGAVLNARPDLFAAAIVAVPFVDVLTTMLDSSLPLTTGEYREWGNPNDPGDYEYMATYSPYDNISAQAYPPVLIEVSLNDSQVPYWEGAKYAAKLRSMTTGGRPVLLKTNLEAGHGGASGRYDAMKEIAFNWAFVLRETGGDIGVKNAPGGA
jgi:oligopeptidase B